MASSSVNPADVPAHEPRVRWLFASLLLLATFGIGIAGLGLARFGPCAASNPIALLFSAAFSVAALAGALLVLTAKQRRLRLRTIPFYLALVLCILFIAVQTLLLVLST